MRVRKTRKETIKIAIEAVIIRVGNLKAKVKVGLYILRINMTILSAIVVFVAIFFGIIQAVIIGT